MSFLFVVTIVIASLNLDDAKAMRGQKSKKAKLAVLSLWERQNFSLTCHS